MKRVAIAAALGGAAVYFFDPQRGEDRRRRAQSLWRKNRDTALEVESGVAQAAESMRPLVRRMKRGVGRGDWAEGGGPNWGLRVTGTILAAALVGSIVFFLDPENGLVRRQRVLSFLMERQDAFKESFGNAEKAASTTKSDAKQAVDEASEAVEEVRAKDRG